MRERVKYLPNWCQISDKKHGMLLTSLVESDTILKCVLVKLPFSSWKEVSDDANQA